MVRIVVYGLSFGGIVKSKLVIWKRLPERDLISLIDGKEDISQNNAH
jgi:hypothetical protein